MLNDRDDKHDEHEESEYHFSDEDVSYEVDAEASSKGSAGAAAGNIMAQLSRYKRMLISFGVFLLLVFIVYKMIMPGTDELATDIVPQTTASVESRPAQSAVISQEPISQAPQQVAPSSNQAENMQQQAVPTAPAYNNQQAVVDMPAVIPVASSVSAAPPQAPAATEITAPPPQAVSAQVPPLSPVVSNGGMDSVVASMAATNEKLMMQLQEDYSQRLKDYANQNRALQDQVQGLNTKIANMEIELSQLVQKLNNEKQQSGPTSLPSMLQVPAQAATPAVLPTVENKTGYTVQAIIPGRAWLKSENGETLTVAEGDTIKDLGRVSKIDPYDGVVEVNTGTKIISISYGNND